MKDKLKALASLIADHRAGEVARPTAEHVARWVNQFDADEQEPLLDELLRVWPAFYLKRDVFEDFLRKTLRTYSTSSCAAAASGRCVNYWPPCCCKRRASR